MHSRPVLLVKDGLVEWLLELKKAMYLKAYSAFSQHWPRPGLRNIPSLCVCTSWSSWCARPCLPQAAFWGWAGCGAWPKGAFQLVLGTLGSNTNLLKHIIEPFWCKCNKFESEGLMKGERGVWSSFCFSLVALLEPGFIGNQSRCNAILFFEVKDERLKVQHVVVWTFLCWCLFLSSFSK